ncbi:glycosyl hydrolase 115 family protein [Acetatifactor muris]|uniref:glycosyl hydrolase 115 family protein n=1 Tax=Acetatifactor muris TaxID=879566 RepID=UPI003FA4CC77
MRTTENLTLIWVNDNYGHIRRYPGEKEKRRRGGNGIYYHDSDRHCSPFAMPLLRRLRSSDIIRKKAVSGR